MRIKAILLMGGAGLRCKSDIPKQFLNLAGKKVYLHTLETFLSFPEFSQILLVCHKKWIKQVASEVSNPRVHIVEGGHTRQNSSYRGLCACGSETTHVMIHDAVRPFVSKTIIQDNLNALKQYKAITTCIPLTDTIVHSETLKEVSSIPPRNKYLRGQTPQSFSYPTIFEAHKKSPLQNASDDCALVLHIGCQVHIVSGSENNIKITEESDLFSAEQLMRFKTTTYKTPSCSLKEKIYAITGGTGGIGSALANLLKKERALPLVISKSSPFFRVDLTDYQQTQSLFSTIYKKYGPIDGLINCVGFLSLKPFHALLPEEINHILATNLYSLIYSCHCAKLKKGGHIVNLSSSSFSKGRKSYVLYSSAKAAIINFTQGFAEECPTLQVNTIIPQRTATAMRKDNFPQEDPSSLLSPMEVAHEILILLKQKGITGSLIEVRKKK